MSNAMTCVCGQPLTGAYLCARCTHALDIAIADIAAHWTDLDNVRAGLVRYGGQGTGEQTPIDPRFDSLEWVYEDGQWRDRIPDGTALLDAVRNTVTTWVRVCLDRWPTHAGPTCEHWTDRMRATPTCMHTSCWRIRRTKPPADDIPACCRYLLGWTRHIAVVEWGPEMLDEMEHLASRLSALVDRPADRWYAGPCDTCERDLYARTGAADVTCPECQLDYDVEERQKRMLEAAGDQLVTAATLSRAMSWLGGLPLSQDRIRKWAERKRIAPRSVNGQTLYRVGDALDLLAAERQKVG